MGKYYFFNIELVLEKYLNITVWFIFKKFS
jgi:hypothetical protein